MKTPPKRRFSSLFSLSVLISSLLVATCLLPGAVVAMVEMEEDVLGEITGEGIALLPENFKAVASDLAYLQAIPTGTPSANVADLYWYGLSLTAASGSNTATKTATETNTRVGGAIASWGTAGNPWLLKVESPSGYKYSGGAAAPYPVFNYYAPIVSGTAGNGDLTGAANTGNATTGTSGRTQNSINVNQLKYAFWADLIVRNKNSPANCTTSASGPTSCTALSKMQSQAVWDGFTLNGSKTSIFQNTYDQSFGLTWINRINSADTGVMRFSVMETTQPAGAATLGRSTETPTFNSGEGLYITNMDINMIVGVQHYQPVILDNAANADDINTSWDETKNFSIEVVRIPNNSTIYNDFYQQYTVTSNISQTTQMGTDKLCSNTRADCSAATHSQIGMGNVTFKNSSGTTVYDAGSSLISGLMIQHLKITTTGL